MGQYGDETGLVSHDSCKLCSAGKFSVIEEIKTDSNCEKCQAGLYGTELGCFRERGSNKNGQPFMLAFDTPETAHINDTHPRFCNFSCTDCPKGKYSTSIGATSLSTCINCPVGKYLDSTGNARLSDCKACPLGRYSSETGVTSAATRTESSMCTSCPQGTYKPTLGGTTVGVCLACPLGKWLTKTNDDIFDGNPQLSFPYGDSGKHIFIYFCLFFQIDN